MLAFLKFVHIIAAMVYFGLPIAFGRWLRAALADPTGASLRETLKKMRMFTFLHLNFCAILILVTGSEMVRGGLYSWSQTWVWLSLALLAVTVINLNLNLGRVLPQKIATPIDKALVKRMRIRIAWFSASHHTLVTLLAALMVYKP